MVFRFTSLSQKKLGIDKLPKEEESSNLFSEWYVSVFYVAHRKYIMTTNAESLYTVISKGAGISDYGSYFSHIFFDIENQLREDDLEFIYFRFIEPLKREIVLSKTINRSVVGSMNDFIFQAQFYLRDLSIYDASSQVNESPMSFLDGKNPIYYLQKYKPSII